MSSIHDQYALYILHADFNEPRICEVSSSENQC